MRLICTFLLALIAMPVFADAPPTTIGGEEAFVHVAPDKPEIIKLSEDAASVVVGSPKYASVTMDNPRTLLIIPRAEGATALTVLNKDGEIIMEKRIIVGGAEEKYVRIRRACNGNSAGCRPSQIYYCPDGCSDISLDTATVEQTPQTGAQTIVPLDTPPPIPPISESQLEQPQ